MKQLLHITIIFLLTVLSQSVSAEENASRTTEFIQDNCLDCHNDADPTADLSLKAFDASIPSGLTASQRASWDTSRWEKVVKRLRTRQMPPADYGQPDEEDYAAAIELMESVLDRMAEEHPRPGRADSIRRLNRTEYQNAIRDLLALEVDATLLPADQAAHGFDNVSLGGLTPVLLERYLSAAEKIARQAVGGSELTPGGATYRLVPDQTQQAHVPGLPLGTRGGGVFEHHFAQSGEYEVQLRLARDRDEHIEGLHAEHEIDLLLDRELIHRFTVKPVKLAEGETYENIDHTLVDAHLKTRFFVTAGKHQLGATFPSRGRSLSQIKRQPFDAAFNRHRHPRPEPAILELSIVGPFDPKGPGDTIPRRRTFARFPQDGGDKEEAKECAEASLRRLMRLAYRRPISNDDLATPMKFFIRGYETDDSAHSDSGGQTAYEAGMQLALTAVLVNPYFLNRTETDPPDVSPGQAFRVSELELASRLSFFLWSSLPDDELLELAEAHQLIEPEILSGQVKRMLADERSESLVTNFAAQWLHLRSLDSFRPDLRLFPDFDDNLRQAMRKETELLFRSVIQDDRNVLDLITTDKTYLNERLAQHYGLPGVTGSHFRPVQLLPEWHRGGLLRHAGILAVTSYATRTAPTIRGAWVLDKLLGSPPLPHLRTLKI